MLRISILRSFRSLEPLREVWQRLYRPGRQTLFQSFAWNLLAACVFAAGAEPMVVHAESDSGAAIIPACIAGGRIGFLGEALFDYRDVLAAGDREVLRRAWQQLARQGQPLEVTALRGERARREWQQMGFSPAPFCSAPAVRREDISADDFAARHYHSARQLRRLARAGVELRSHAGSDSAMVREIYQAKARQEIAANLFADSRRIDFMVAIADADPGCEIFTLEAGGSLAGALVSFRDDRVRRFYTVYYDRRWAHYSPGIALIHEVTRRSLEQGLDCDYMTGEHAHKTRYATRQVPLFRVEAQDGELARLLHAGPAIPVAA